MKKIVVLLFTFALMTGIASAQEGGSVIFNYSVGFTAGSTKDFVSPVSGRGFNFDVRFNVRENISLGALVGWNYFYERKDRQAYSVTSNNVTADVNVVQTRYLNMIPLIIIGLFLRKF